MSTVFRGEPGGPEFAARGVAAATGARDWWGFVHAALWEANGTASCLEPAYVHVLRRRREALEDLGAPHPYVAWLSAAEAGTGWMPATGRSARTGCGSRSARTPAPAPTS